MYVCDFISYIVFLPMFLFFFCLTFKEGFFLLLTTVFYEKQEELPTHSMVTSGILVHRDQAKLDGFETWFFFASPEERVVKEPLVWLNQKPSVVYTPYTSCYREKVEYYYITNSYFRPNKLRRWDIYLENGDYLNLVRNPLYGEPKPSKETLTSKYAFRFVATIPFFWPVNWGHCVIDGITGVVNMPEWIWELNPVFVVGANGDLMREFFKAFSLEHIQVIESVDLIYGEHIFLCKESYPWNGFGIKSIGLVKKKFFEYYHLERIQPQNYYFLNKEPGKRHFDNLPELISKSCEVTGLDWKEIDMPNFNDRDATVKLFASIKILVCPAGSLAFNSIYMHDETGMLSLMANELDLPQFKVLYGANVWCIAIIHSSMAHLGGSGNANIDECVECLTKLVYTVKNRHYPPNHLYKGLNFEYAKKLYFENGDKWTTVFGANDEIYNEYINSLNSSKSIS